MVQNVPSCAVKCTLSQNCCVLCGYSGRREIWHFEWGDVVMGSRKILVTGATGHLGANLVRRLLADGEAVRVMVRHGYDKAALTGLDVECVEADLVDRNSVAAAVQGCAQVYHCAALVSTIAGDTAHKRLVYDTNVCGTIHVLDAARRHGVDKVVVSGSLSATGHDPATPSHEDMPFYPFDRQLPYGFSKHLAEHECLRAHADGLNVVIATSCAIVGPHDYVPSRMGRVLIDYAHGKLGAYIPGGFEFVSGRDIAEGHVLAMQKGRSGQKYIFSTAYSSVDDFLDIFREVTGQPLPRLRLPPVIMAAIAEVSDKTWFRLFPNAPRRFTPAAVRLLSMHRRVTLDKARQELGYEPTALADAVHDAYEDFVRRGVITPRERTI
jgi:nucleoside-diphosphate-sugar epimerase